MRRCPTCQKQFTDEVEFCPDHGAPLNPPEPLDVAHAPTMASSGAAPQVPQTIKSDAAPQPEPPAAPVQPAYAPSPQPDAGGYPAATPGGGGGYPPATPGGPASPPPPHAGGPAQPPEPKKGGALKFVIIAVILLVVLGGIGTAVAVFRLDKKIMNMVASKDKGDKDKGDKDKGDKDKDKGDKDDDDDDDDDDEGDKKKKKKKKKKTGDDDDSDDDDEDSDDDQDTGPVGSAVALIPSSYMVVVSAPRLDKLQSGAGALLARFNGTPFSKARLSREIKRELGLDIFSKSDLKSTGLDLSKGAALGVGANDSVIVVAAEADKGKLDKFLREKANSKGNVEFKTWDLPGGAKGVAMYRTGSSRVRAVWTHAKGYMVLCGGKRKGLKDMLKKVVSRGGKQMAADANYKRLVKQVGQHDVLMYVNGPVVKRETLAKRKRQIASASDYMKSYYTKKLKNEQMAFAYFDGYVMGVRLMGDKALVRSYLAVPMSARVAIRSVMEGKGSPVALAKYMASEPVALVSLSFDAKMAMEMLKKVMPAKARQDYDQGVQTIEAQTGLSLNDDVFGQLAGRYAAALFAPTAKQIKKLARSNRAHELAQWVALGKINNEGKVNKVLQTAADISAKNDVKFKTAKVSGAKVYTFKERKNEYVSWAATRGHILVGAPKRVKQSIKLLAGKGSPADLPVPAREALKKDSALVVYLDAARVLELMGHVPGNREVKGVAAMLSPLGHAVFTAEVQGAGVMMDLVLGFREGGAAPADDDSDDSSGSSSGSGSSGSGSSAVKAEASGASTGIPECDVFLRKYKACINKMPESARPGMQRGLASMRTSYTRAGKYPSARKSLGDSCKKTIKTMAKSLARYNCKW